MAVRKKARPSMKRVKKAGRRAEPPVCKPQICEPAGPRICIPDILCEPIRAKRMVAIGEICNPIPKAFELIESRIIIANKRVFEVEKVLGEIRKEVKAISKKVR